jgi:hypothetical protein
VVRGRLYVGGWGGRRARRVERGPLGPPRLDHGCLTTPEVSRQEVDPTTTTGGGMVHPLVVLVEEVW